MEPFNITRAAHAEIRVTDLKLAKEFYVNALGMVHSGRDAKRMYLRGYEETDKYSLILRKAKTAGLGHISFRVAGLEDLSNIPIELSKNGAVETYWSSPDRQKGGREQGVFLHIQDPFGIPVKFFHDIEKRESLMQKFHLHRGANIMRIDHFNWQVPSVEAAMTWWKNVMGFRVSEYTVDERGYIWAAWLHRKQNVHDVAIMSGVGPRLHHVGFWVKDTASILNACDILASMGMADCIERGPGRHGISNAFFLYLRDPDGNRIELFTNDYMIPDPDHEPKVWNLNDPMRATFWGHKPPASWFEEASLVENIHTGEFMPVSEPFLKDRPNFVT